MCTMYVHTYVCTCLYQVQCTYVYTIYTSYIGNLNDPVIKLFSEHCYVRTLPIEKGDGQVTIVCCIVASVGITVSYAVGYSVPADWPWGHSLHTPFVIRMLHRPKERRCLSGRHHSPKAWRGRWPSQDTTSSLMWRTSVCWQRRPHPKKL